MSNAQKPLQKWGKSHKKEQDNQKEDNKYYQNYNQKEDNKYYQTNAEGNEYPNKSTNDNRSNRNKNFSNQEYTDTKYSNENKFVKNHSLYTNFNTNLFSYLILLINLSIELFSQK